MAGNLYITTDDGSYVRKGMGTDVLKDLYAQGKKYDKCIAIGPLIMMKFVCLLTKELGIPTVVSMNLLWLMVQVCVVHADFRLVMRLSSLV